MAGGGPSYGFWGGGGAGSLSQNTQFQSGYDSLATTGGGGGGAAAGGMSGLGAFSVAMSVAGALNSAIGGFYAAKSQQYQLKSQALNAEFQAGMASMNARAAEIEAQSVLRSGQQAIGMATMRAGQEQAARRASLGARGVAAGVGSTREVAASAEYVKQADVFAINTNAVQAAEARRMQAVNYRNQALMGRMSAQNLRSGAGSISPGLSAFSSLLGGAGPVASNWAMMNYMGAV